MPDFILASGRTLYGEQPSQAHLDPVVTFDARSGRFITANPAAICSYGYSHAEFMFLTAEAPCAPGPEHVPTIERLA